MGRSVSIIALLLSCLSLFAQAPDPYFPKDGMVVEGPAVTFRWNTYANATTYELQYANNPAFTGAVNISSIATTERLVSSLTLGNFYYWRVRANTPAGTTPWSRTFRVGLYTPANIPNLIFWIKADGSLVTNGSNQVTQWSDISGNNNNLTQIDVAKAPVLQSNVLNGKPVVSFDGANDFMTGSDILDILNSNRSIFFLGKNNATTGAYFAKAQAGTANNRYALYNDGNGINFLWKDNTEINYTFNNGSGFPDLVSIIINRTNTNYKVYLETDSLGAFTKSGIQNTSYNMNSAFRFLLGAYNNATDLAEIIPLNGYVAEMFMFNDALSPDNRKVMERYLLDKYAPPVNLGKDIVFDYSLCDTVLKAGKYFVSYNWSNGSTDSLITVSQPGVYSVTTTDVFGRTTTDTIKIIKPNFEFAGTPRFCTNDSILWNTGLNPALYNFNWSNGKTTPSIYISTPGTYRVTVQDTSGCALASAAVVFTQDSLPWQVSLTTGPDTSLCSGNILGLAKGANFVSSYSWSTGAMTPTIAVDTPGNYKVTVTNSLGCMVSDSVNVNILGQGPSVNFTNDTACLGDSIHFTDLSSIPAPASIGSWKWYFGNGDSSSVQNPTYLYNNTGTYSVTLVASSGSGCEGTPFSRQVTVNPPIIANFNDTLGCIGKATEFNDASMSLPSDTIISWYWDFDNSNSSNQQNPSEQFSSAGIYDVSLTVNSLKGCTDTFSRPVNIVSTYPAPGNVSLVTPGNGVNISSTHINFCWNAAINAIEYRLQVSNNPNFTSFSLNQVVTGTCFNTAAIPQSTNTYYWRVIAIGLCGDQQISTSRTFTKINPNLIPNLALWVSADGPLTKDASNFVSIWNDQSGNANNVFQNTASSRPRWADSLAQLNYNPVIRFTGNEFFDGGDLLDLRKNSQTVFIIGKMTTNGTSPANVYLSKSTGGNNPFRYAIFRENGLLTYLFHGQNGPAGPSNAAATTNFGNYEMVTSTVCRNNQPYEVRLYKNSDFLGIAPGIDNSSVDFNSSYRFLIGAYGTGASSQSLFLKGEIAEIIIYDTCLSQTEIAAIEGYLYDKYSRPVTLGPDITVNYGYCNQITLDASERYIWYQWSTGDTTQTIPINNSGTYSVTVSDAFGQISSDTVIVNIPSLPPPPDTIFCEGDSIIWNVNQGPAYKYLWSTGDTTPSLTVTQQGFYAVTISDTISSAQGGPCSASVGYNFVIDSFSLQTTLGPDTIMCGNALLGVKNNPFPISNFLWSTGSADSVISITSSGQYSVTATSTNGCSAIDTINITLSGVLPDVDFFVDQSSCFGDTLNIANLTTLAPPFQVISHTWTFGDTSSPEVTISPDHYYTAPGVYDITLTTVADSGCTASTMQTVTVYEKPEAEFTYQIGCAGTPMLFTDLSTAVTNDPITNWLWSFGDGETSTFRNPSHTYATGGVYEVSLRVTSATGCFTTFTDTIEVYPAIEADIEVTNLCFGDVVQFYDASTTNSNVEWFWQFGDATFSFDKNPTHLYNQAGTYEVSLTVTNAVGCELTIFDTITITLPPVADFTFTETCIGKPVLFEETSTINGGDTISAWYWNFGDSTAVRRNPDPFHVYDSAGVYTVTLTVVSANGCSDVVTQQVTVAPPPVAAFTFTPDYGASPLEVEFTNNSIDGISYLWEFGDGDTSRAVSPTHTYTNDGFYTIKLTAFGTGGCTDVYVDSIDVIFATLDLEVSTITATTDGDRVYLTALVANVGTRNITNFDIKASLGGGASPFIEAVDTSIISGRLIQYQFVASYLATQTQSESYLCIETMNPNGEQDNNVLNDKQCIPLQNNIKMVPPYPNPAADWLNFDVILHRDADMEIMIVNDIGQNLGLVYEGAATKGLNSYRISVAHLKEGIYLLQVKYGGEYYVEKFVVDK